MISAAGMGLTDWLYTTRPTCGVYIDWGVIERIRHPGNETNEIEDEEQEGQEEEGEDKIKRRSGNNLLTSESQTYPLHQTVLLCMALVCDTARWHYSQPTLD